MLTLMPVALVFNHLIEYHLNLYVYTHIYMHLYIYIYVCIYKHICCKEIERQVYKYSLENKKSIVNHRKLIRLPSSYLNSIRKAIYLCFILFLFFFFIMCSVLTVYVFIMDWQCAGN